MRKPVETGYRIHTFDIVIEQQHGHAVFAHVQNIRQAQQDTVCFHAYQLIFCFGLHPVNIFTVVSMCL